MTHKVLFRPKPWPSIITKKEDWKLSKTKPNTYLQFPQPKEIIFCWHKFVVLSEQVSFYWTSICSLTTKKKSFNFQKQPFLHIRYNRLVNNSYYLCVIKRFPFSLFFWAQFVMSKHRIKVTKVKATTNWLTITNTFRSKPLISRLKKKIFQK